MTTCYLAPDPIQSTQFIPGGAVPANGGQLFFYAAGSSTKQTVYKDNAANTAWSNPIVLDSGGNLPSGGEVWFPSGQTFKVVFAPSTDTDPPSSPYWTKDNLSGMNDTSVTGSEWLSGPAPTFVSATSFTLVGDQTGTFTVGRRLKFTVTAGTVYGRITASTFGALTTVTMAMDGIQALDSGLSAVSYALLASNVKSEPERIGTTSGQDTYTVTQGIARYVIGDEYKLNFSSTNATTTPTLNSDSVGALNLKRPDGSSLVAGDLSGEHTIRVQSTSAAIVMNPRNTPLALLQVVTANNTSVVNMTTSINSSFDMYTLEFDNVLPTSNATQLMSRISQDGGSTWKSTGYRWACGALFDNGTRSDTGSTSATEMRLINGALMSSTLGNVVAGTLDFYNPSMTNVFKPFKSRISGLMNGPNFSAIDGGGIYSADGNQINGVQLYPGGGNFSTGTFRLYGWRKQ